MSEQDNVEIVKQSFVAFQRGDMQTVLNLCADDIEFRHPMSTAIWPWAGQHRGRAQLAALAAGFWEVEEFEQFEPQEFIAQGDTVVAIGVYSGVAKANGQRARSDWAMVFNLRDGKVARFREFCDCAALVRAHGGVLVS